MERLDRVLSRHGLGSRREVNHLVRAGRVTVDGEVLKDGSSHVDPRVAAIALDGELLPARAQWHLLCHKPGGIVTSTADPRDPCVLDQIPPEYWRSDYVPVGRLDKDTTGLLWLTTDGALVHRLTHPRWKLPKRYRATLRDPASADDVRAFTSGEILLDGEPILPALLDLGPDPHVVGVTLREGRFHQVKRMFHARGNEVVALARVAFGPQTLGPDLPEGSYRPPTPAEERAMYAAVSLVSPDLV